MKLLSVGVILFSMNLMADDFQARKSKWSANLDNKISDLQKTKSCVDAATDHEALKKCQKDRKETFKEARKERKERFKNKRTKDKTKKSQS